MSVLIFLLLLFGAFLLYSHSDLEAYLSYLYNTLHVAKGSDSPGTINVPAPVATIIKYLPFHDFANSIMCGRRRVSPVANAVGNLIDFQPWPEYLSKWVRQTSTQLKHHLERDDIKAKIHRGEAVAQILIFLTVALLIVAVFEAAKACRASRRHPAPMSTKAVEPSETEGRSLGNLRMDVGKLHSQLTELIAHASRGQEDVAQQMRVDFGSALRTLSTHVGGIRDALLQEIGVSVGAEAVTLHAAIIDARNAVDQKVNDLGRQLGVDGEFTNQLAEISANVDKMREDCAPKMHIDFGEQMEKLSQHIGEAHQNTAQKVHVDVESQFEKLSAQVSEAREDVVRQVPADLCAQLKQLASDNNAQAKASQNALESQMNSMQRDLWTRMDAIQADVSTNTKNIGKKLEQLLQHMKDSTSRIGSLEENLNTNTSNTQTLITTEANILHNYISTQKDSQHKFQHELQNHLDAIIDRLSNFEENYNTNTCNTDTLITAETNTLHEYINTQKGEHEIVQHELQNHLNTITSRLSQLEENHNTNTSHTHSLLATQTKTLNHAISTQLSTRNDLLIPQIDQLLESTLLPYSRGMYHLLLESNTTLWRLNFFMGWLGAKKHCIKTEPRAEDWCFACNRSGHKQADCTRCPGCKKNEPNLCSKGCKYQLRRHPDAKHPGKALKRPESKWGKEDEAEWKEGQAELERRSEEQRVVKEAELKAEEEEEEEGGTAKREEGGTVKKEEGGTAKKAEGHKKLESRWAS